MKYEIIDYDHFGRGITKINNKVVFVDGGIKGDIVSLKIIKSGKKFDEAEIVKLFSNSKYRRNPPCPYYKKCGGCDIQHITYPGQLLFKEEKIKNIVYKYLHMSNVVKNIIKCDCEFGYRNKITLQIKKQEYGFFTKLSNNIVPINKCLLANDYINNSISKIKITKKTDQIIMRNGCNGTLIYNLTNKKIDNHKPILMSFDNIVFSVSPESFFQVNTLMFAKIIEYLKSYVSKIKSPKIVDLFCGCGTIGLELSPYASEIIGIEVNKKSVESAIKNASNNNINNARFICENIKSDTFSKYNPDVIVLDPPRSGVNKEVISGLINSNANMILYISCDPLTLVRDLKLLNNAYEIIEITPFDMFPNTHHVECVSVLCRK